MCRRDRHAAAEYIIYHWNEPIVPITGTADVVRELKARGYTLYLLSNAARRQHTYWHDIPGSECFSGTLISADVHLLKPEAAIDVYKRQPSTSPTIRRRR